MLLGSVDVTQDMPIAEIMARHLPFVAKNFKRTKIWSLIFDNII